MLVIRQLLLSLTFIPPRSVTTTNAVRNKKQKSVTSTSTNSKDNRPEIIGITLQHTHKGAFANQVLIFLHRPNTMIAVAIGHDCYHDWPFSPKNSPSQRKLIAFSRRQGLTPDSNKAECLHLVSNRLRNRQTTSTNTYLSKRHIFHGLKQPSIHC